MIDPENPVISYEELKKDPDAVVRALSQAHGSGYVLVRGMLHPEDVREAHKVINASFPVWLCRRLSGYLEAMGGSARCYDLVSRSPVFSKILDDEALFAVLEKICGKGVKVGAFDTNTTFPTKGPKPEGSDNGELVSKQGLQQGVHIDFPYGAHAWFLAGDQNPPLGAPRTVQVLWMLDNFTKLNGCTAIKPNSHEPPASPNYVDEVKFEEEMNGFIKEHKRVEGKAGDAMIYVGNLWHCVPKNFSEHTRTCLIGQFLPYYCVSMGGCAIVTPRSHFAKLPPRAKSLLTEKVKPVMFTHWLHSQLSTLVHVSADTGIFSATARRIGLPILSAVILACYFSPRNKAFYTAAASSVTAYFAGIVTTMFYRDLEVAI